MLMWLIVALCPLLTILYSFILQKWTWGLMDDLQILESGSTIMERSISYLKTTRAFGQFKPLHAFHSGIFYTLFEHAPHHFHIFKLLEICLVLLIWGYAAYRITHRKIVITLLPAITLSFHYFYDAFFYLPAHEMTGLLFLGVSMHFFLSHLKDDFNANLDEKQAGITQLHWKSFLLGLFFLLCSFWSKEPFVSCGMALALSYFFLAWFNRETRYVKSASLFATILLFVTSAHAFILLKFVKSAYTSSYAINNISKLSSNIMSWLRKDFINHIPWVMGAALIFYLANKKIGIKKALSELSIRIKWGICLGIFLYFGFFLILLPWNTVAYYATPFGLFFAFTVVLLISGCLPKISVRWQTFMVISALLMNQFVCLYALKRESIYQYDTMNLMAWFNKDNSIRTYSQNNMILCNAMEASGAIPGLINKQWDLHLKSFRWSLDPDELIDEKKTSFYLFSPRFHSIDLNKLNQWKIVFYSKNWIMYSRLKDTAERIR